MSQQLVIGIIGIQGSLRTGWKVEHLSTNHGEVAAIMSEPPTVVVQTAYDNQDVIDLITDYVMYQKQDGGANVAAWVKLIRKQSENMPKQQEQTYEFETLFDFAFHYARYVKYGGVTNAKDWFNEVYNK